MSIASLPAAKRSENGKTDCSPRWFAFETPLGWMGVVCNEHQLERVTFGHERFEQLVEALEDYDVDLSCPLNEATSWAGDCVRRLKRFAAGESESFDSVPLAVKHLTPFGLRVMNACRAVGWGEVLTYSELASRVGSPGAARAVGNVMACNRFPLVVPCHRVVGSGGGLGGYSAPGGIRTKLALLEREGVRTRSAK